MNNNMEILKDLLLAVMRATAKIIVWTVGIAAMLIWELTKFAGRALKFACLLLLVMIGVLNDECLN